MQTHRLCITPRVNPKVNFGLCVITMCRCRLISCNKCTTPGSMWIMEEAVHVWEQQVYGKISVPSSEFCYKSKSTLKKLTL